jgi:hypothetical protein
VQRQNNHGFSAVACDQTIEQTANRDSKTKGGLIGFSMNPGTVHRWLLSQSERAAITRKCNYMAGMECKPKKEVKLFMHAYYIQSKNNLVKQTFLFVILKFTF